MKIYLDDERNTPDGWVRAYTVEGLIAMYEGFGNQISTISLDHDLGINPETGRLLPTGLSFLTYLIDKLVDDPKTYIPELLVHSANPVGAKRMRDAIQDIKRIQE